MRTYEFILEYTQPKLEQALKSLFKPVSYEESNMGLMFPDGSIISGKMHNGEWHDDHPRMMDLAAKKAGMGGAFNGDGSVMGKLMAQMGVMRYRRDFAKFVDMPPNLTREQRNVLLAVAKEANDDYDDFTLGKVHDYRYIKEYGMSGEDWTVKEVAREVRMNR